KAEKKKAVSGAFVVYKDGTLTIKVQAKKGEEAKAQEFKVADDTKVITFDGENKKEGAAEDGVKNLKEGTAVTVTLGESDKVAAVQVGAAKKAEKKEHTVSGAFASYKDGTLTLKVLVTKGEEPKAQEFKVADGTKVITFDGENKKE